ncbi:MAG: hypothetical protein RLZ30_116 [Actinomycetota bacterium]|jgi:hypothetical protein
MSNEEGVAKRLGLSKNGESYQLDGKSLLSGIGGGLGIAEAVLPATTFSIVFAVTQQALPAVVSAATLSLLFIVVRLLKKQGIQQSVIGALAIALAAFLALRDGGQAADYFITGLLTNLAYGTVLLVSVLIRRPLMGFVAQLLFGLTNWRTSREYKRLRLITLIWVAFFALRLLVQVPLYFANMVELLAASRVVMGAPAYAGLLALTWILMKRIAIDEKGKLEGESKEKSDGK